MRAVHDPWDLADTASTTALLRCWVREQALAVPRDALRVDLPATGTRLHAEVTYASTVGWHRFGTVRLGNGAPADAVTVAVLLAREAAARRGSGPANVADLVARVADSVRRGARHVERRGLDADGLATTTPFLAAEQALLLGHPLHPAPMSREGLTDGEADAYSPELRGRFPLHWFAASREVVSTSGTRAERAVTALAPAVPPGTVPVPAHPWQARDVRPRVRALLDAGLLRDLGPAGPAWSPTSSLRTVYRPDAAVMLKLSLGLRITNSRRENLRKELLRGAEIDRLLDAGLAGELAAEHPGFAIVRDPGWLAVEVPDGRQSGLEAVVRDNPFGAGERVACVAGLVAERPDIGRSAIAALVHDLAARTGRTAQDIAEEWFGRYLRAVVVPVLWLYERYGLALEAHQQNTLAVLDEEGWPVGGRYRDNQGYYISATRAGRLDAFLPGVGKESDSRCDDDVIDERIGYYLGVNNALGLVGALGSQRLADERRLLARLREALLGTRGGVGTALATAPTLRCKANLLTRIDALDELVGPLASQSVYCDIPNPMRVAAR